MAVRDTAIIRVLIDTGIRRAELLGMTVEDVDFDQDVVYVLGKGRRERACPVGRRTAMALDRYLRQRSKLDAGVSASHRLSADAGDRCPDMTAAPGRRRAWPDATCAGAVGIPLAPS